MDKTIQFIFLFLGALGVMNTIFVLIYSNINLGNLFPGILGILFILYGIFRSKLLFFTQHGFGKFFRLTVISGIFLFLISFLILTLIIYLNSSKTPSKGADAVIVLGAGLNGTKVSRTLSYRLDKAVTYYQENPDTILIVSGGQGNDEPIPEALAMKNYLIEKNIPEEKIKMEEESTNTKENFLFSKKILDETFEESYRVVYVTNDFHIFRAGMIAEDCGLSAEGLSSPSYTPMLPNFYIREYFSLLKYYLIG